MNGTQVEVLLKDISNKLKALIDTGILVDTNVNIDAVAGTAIKTGHGTAAGTVRVELPTDGTGVVGLNAGENHLGEIGSKIVNVQAEYTRPADTNAYAAKDVYSNSTSSPSVLTFTNIARVSGGSGEITFAVAATDQKTNTARFRLHLFNSSPTAINDNAAFTWLYANNASYQGFIDFPAMSTEDPTNSTGAYSQNGGSNVSLPFPFVTNGSRNLFGIVEIIDAFTPASGQKLNFSLTAKNN